VLETKKAPLLGKNPLAAAAATLPFVHFSLVAVAAALPLAKSLLAAAAAKPPSGKFSSATPSQTRFWKKTRLRRRRKGHF
jgi:hypothetical protein